MSLFYRKLVELWLNCKKVFKLDEISNPKQEIIWNNENIKYNGKTLYFKHWIRNGYVKISSMYNKEGNKMSMMDLNSKIVKPGGIMMDFNTLKLAIPKCWNNTNLLNPNNECNVLDIIENDKHRYYSLEQCTSRIVRRKLVDDMSVTPISQAFWKRKCPQYIFRWNIIWKNIPENAKQARLITLNWKIVCNIYPTKILLAKMGIARNSKCNTCDDEDYLEHFFFNCKTVTKLWLEINTMILEETGMRVHISVADAMFVFL